MVLIMALTENGLSPADLAAITGNNNNNEGLGGIGGWWIIVFFILLIFNNGWGGFNGGSGADNAVQRGFDQASVMSGVGSINTGISTLQQALCSGFAGVSNSFAQAEIGANARQMANMQQMFALQNQFADHCCENRLALANLQSTIIAENCADREALNNGVRDIVANQNSGIQTILDKMCQQELDAERRENDNLRTQLYFANWAASQNDQTAKITADNAAQTQILMQSLNPTPVPAYMVQNPNCCAQNVGCGCSY